MTDAISRAQPTPNLETLLAGVAQGEQHMFAPFYDQIAGRVYGLVRSIVRDSAQAEEVSQEILVELWQTAPRYSREKATVITWVMTVAQRRAADRVRSAAASSGREQSATVEASTSHPIDQVAEAIMHAGECGTAWASSP